jgi:hypothetical protein
MSLLCCGGESGGGGGGSGAEDNLSGVEEVLSGGWAGFFPAYIPAFFPALMAALFPALIASVTVIRSGEGKAREGLVVVVVQLPPPTAFPPDPTPPPPAVTGRLIGVRGEAEACGEVPLAGARVAGGEGFGCATACVLSDVRCMCLSLSRDVTPASLPSSCLSFSL